MQQGSGRRRPWKGCSGRRRRFITRCLHHSLGTFTITPVTTLSTVIHNNFLKRGIVGRLHGRHGRNSVLVGNRQAISCGNQPGRLGGRWTSAPGSHSGGATLTQRTWGGGLGNAQDPGQQPQERSRSSGHPQGRGEGRGSGQAGCDIPGLSPLLSLAHYPSPAPGRKHVQGQSYKTAPPPGSPPVLPPAEPRVPPNSPKPLLTQAPAVGPRVDPASPPP